MVSTSSRDRFRAIMAYEPFDRLPVWYFGTWQETKVRWKSEGLAGIGTSGSAGPDIPGMDPDWESGMWQCHGLADPAPISAEASQILEETDSYRVVRTPLGAVQQQGKQSTPPHTIEYALKPTRESWRRFKQFLDPCDPARRCVDWEARAVKLNARERVTTFVSSFYGWPREWMGVEQISYLPFDDPGLFEEILDYLCDYYIALYRPVLEKVRFDFAYFFEDCCYRAGPLISPSIYQRFYHKYYRRLIRFYRDMGIEHILLDSDGKVDTLIPYWIESGINIIFPIEVGVWEADPVALRQRFGKDLKMMGGVDKHVIAQGQDAVRRHLEHLEPLVQEGGYIPMPDHRIPPSCSLADFRSYLRTFRQVFGIPSENGGTSSS